MDLVQAHLAELLVVVLGLVLVQVRQWVEDRLARVRLESALGRAVGLVLADERARSAAEGLRQAAIIAARSYVREAIPDTLRRLGVNDARLEKMILAEVALATGGEQ